MSDAVDESAARNSFPQTGGNVSESSDRTLSVEAGTSETSDSVFRLGRIQKKRQKVLYLGRGNGRVGVMTVALSVLAKKQLKQLDKSVQKRITKFLTELTELADSRSKGKRLVGDLKSFWRYRVGGYRLICRIHDEELEILVVEVGHRK